ncbi:3-oxoacyl-[acyl-carrier-protein] synthase III C-terminal domain-containing protein [Corallococcus sp. Z5C101001]|uniref:3-oxoacyl-[acyl-carrier-protein] synthase III C-terminal domain-containing protein n=1 Tax=Corallococcus sp. Z5C101001 TaxID=2596829 RepID=UPI00117D8383|nr:3-oxoacyl-[acyl-carrier-protein] synthase III C-terminal domain-containing protein [Corallococcus sp. Z5C101001]TSC26059.1 3-oxoacyl-ACP synthase [Corallococcus sp. Z5C101001]
MSAATYALLGVGAAVPGTVRGNEDPLFEPLRRAAGSGGEHALFYGNRERRVLGPGESLASLTARAGAAALQDAGLTASDVQRLYGYVSVSEFIAPNALYAVHRELGLGQGALVVPVQADFANFLMGVVLAWEALRAGSIQHALVAVGSAWTRNVDYTQGHAIGIGDGAGAVVVGAGERLTLVDWGADTFSDEYGAMMMGPRPESGLAHPTYGIAPTSGVQAFLNSGMNGPPRLVERLLHKHGVAREDVTLISHQATRKLMDHWAKEIRPREYLDTFEDFGNMVHASIPVTLARFHRELRTKYLVMVGLGIGAHQMALLVRV